MLAKRSFTIEALVSQDRRSPQVWEPVPPPLLHQASPDDRFMRGLQQQVSRVYYPDTELLYPQGWMPPALALPPQQIAHLSFLSGVERPSPAHLCPWPVRHRCYTHRHPDSDAPRDTLLLHGPLAWKPKRIRTAFSPSQLLHLESAFEKSRYVVGSERKQLASNLCLSETQVKVWFQNRRTKHRRQKLEEEPTQQERRKDRRHICMWRLATRHASSTLEG